MATDLHLPHQVDPDGDIILFTPKTPLIDISKGNVPGNYARFQVSSKHLTLVSGYFKRTLRNCWSGGNALSTKGSAEIPERLQTRYPSAHFESYPWTFTTNSSQVIPAAIKSLVFAGSWIKALESRVPSSFSQDMKTWMMISSVFKSPKIFKTAKKNRHAGSNRAIRDKQSPGSKVR
ncbi:hypothetical protein N7463_001135 [Penicillium fimorum]|uniref:Uncharacterized protein n=1 Tax=Penicillium fimorum TaxID=1882269 RepID=A0A9W9Y5K4_9EURO|nr:hypothetical protein N7463_001135 [Penicillium fimorum]